MQLLLVIMNYNQNNRVMKEYICPHCGQELVKSTTEGYTFQCVNCDEDFVSIEVITG